MTRIERRSDPVATGRILRALPSWFGLEEAVRDYVGDASVLPSYLAVSGSATIGVALVRRHFPESAELHLIAVHPDARGSGAGTLLLNAVEEDLRCAGVRLLQVKTIGASYEHEGYAQTRGFYRARGFLPVAEMRGLVWDGPTLLLVKVIAPDP
ncbi:MULTISPECIES: GNAT family N-acetyltransferase [unclassified Actinoplanes]|uniref:GNAT family N-acetyltransferase n=1 Tax=unclassified Actinoplanes TaxID=2626549 RepID=UPI00030BA1F4|nr:MULTISPECIES: GNAT family N-acetyltransferase [unclassified Actinoplanes]